METLSTSQMTSTTPRQMFGCLILVCGIHKHHVHDVDHILALLGDELRRREVDTLACLRVNIFVIINIGIWYSYHYLIISYHYMLITYLHRCILAYGPTWKQGNPNPNGLEPGFSRENCRKWGHFQSTFLLDAAIRCTERSFAKGRSRCATPCLATRQHPRSRNYSLAVRLCKGLNLGGKPRKIHKVDQIDLFGGGKVLLSFIIHIPSYPIPSLVI